MKEIPLSSGKVALVDDEDYERLRTMRWCASKDYRREVWYALSHPKRGVKIIMHRLIMGARKGQIVDHRDGDGLNNTRANLRICTRAENSRNRAKLKKRSKTGFKGVYICTDRHGWYRASITVNHKVRPLGRFTTAVEAAEAYDRAAKHYFKDFARLNFPEVAA